MEYFVAIRHCISAQIVQIVGPYETEFLAERDSDFVGEGLEGYYCEVLGGDDLLLEKAPKRVLN